MFWNEMKRLWGNPTHLDYVAASLRERYGADRLHILAAERNAGNFTYDGIELGGERLAHEIEDTLEALAGQGHTIRKLSIVGYSLGGLVARYALGLLYARRWLDKLEPVNFTTFVTPHVGVRTPLKGIQNHIWNVLGARTISMSGRQLFMIDSFRETGKPLLSTLADPESIFIKALARFKHRSAYANIVNDRSAVFYTTGISKFDLFPDVETANFNYVKGYEPVVVDSDIYTLPPGAKEPNPLDSHVWHKMMRIITNLPFWFFILFFVPVGSFIFLLNAVVQTIRSRQRIRLHEQGKTGVFFESYRVPPLVQDVQNAVEDVFENVNSSQDPDYLSPTDEQNIELPKDESTLPPSSPQAPEIVSNGLRYPVLALTPAQFAIIDSLNAVGFRRYPVYIHKHRHSHAAIIVRMPKKGFEEGRVVIKHWLDKEFVV